MTNEEDRMKYRRLIDTLSHRTDLSQKKVEEFLDSPLTLEKLEEFGREMPEQDHRMTSHPMYCVRTQRISRYESDSPDAECVEWADEGGNVAVGDLENALENAHVSGIVVLCAAFDADGNFVRIYEESDEDDQLEDDQHTKYLTRFAVEKRWEVVTTFFTNAAAELYIKKNAHNLCEPHVYVDSGYRNEEWIFVRALLMALGQYAIHEAEQERKAAKILGARSN